MWPPSRHHHRDAGRRQIQCRQSNQRIRHHFRHRLQRHPYLLVSIRYIDSHLYIDLKKFVYN